MKYYLAVLWWIRWILLPIVFIAAGKLPASSEEITFRISFTSAVQLPPDVKMMGHIKMKTPERKYYNILSFTVPSPGHKKTEEIKCSQPGIYFTAEVTSIFYQLDDFETEKQCQSGEIIFMFHEKKYSVELRKAMEGSDFYKVRFNDVNLVNLQSDLTKALELQDAATALVKSSQLHDSLLKTGFGNLADPYRVLSLDIATKKLKVGNGDLFFDPMQKKYVLDKDTVNHIKNLQTTYNLTSDGKLNWKTMKAIGQLIE